MNDPTEIARSVSPLTRLAFWKRGPSTNQSINHSFLVNTSALALQAAQSPSKKDESFNLSINQSNDISINQSTHSNQSIDDSNAESINQSINQSMSPLNVQSSNSHSDQSINHSITQSINQPTPVRSYTSSYYDSIPSLAVFNQSINQSLPPSPNAQSISQSNSQSIDELSIQSINQSINQSTKQSYHSPETSPRPVHMPRAPSLDIQLQSLLDQSINQSINQSNDQSNDQETDQSINQSVNQSIKQTKRLKTLITHLQNESINLPALRSACWAGCPDRIRPIIWKLMLGVLPISKHRRDAALHSRRCEYWEYLRAYDQCIDSSTNQHDDILRQIRADIPRTCPGLSFFQLPPIKQSIERVLFTFAHRHPASGYVQGMNDLVTPFYAVLIREFVEIDIMHNESVDELVICDDWLMIIESDCYWCLSALIDGIQDHFTFAQPGIQRQIFSLQALVSRVDPALSRHLEEANIQFLHFAFRWMNCLLMRELSLPLILRLWDSYLCHEQGPAYGFKTFHVYFCVAFLVRFSRQLQMLEFADLIVYLQRLPTEAWKQQDINELVAQAFIFQTLFEGDSVSK